MSDMEVLRRAFVRPAIVYEQAANEVEAARRVQRLREDYAQGCGASCFGRQVVVLVPEHADPGAKFRVFELLDFRGA